MKLGWLFYLSSLFPTHVQEQTCLAATVYLEARDQSQRGQEAVAEVALRRRESRRWGANVCDVVLKRHQFAPSFTSKDYQIISSRAWDRAWKIAGDTLRMWSLPPSQRLFVVPGADHFVALDQAQPVWAQGVPVATIGDHTFYRVGL